MSTLERRDRTTQVERYFWMTMSTAGLFASVVRPAAGLLLLGGGGLRLWAIGRSQK